MDDFDKRLVRLTETQRALLVQRLAAIRGGADRTETASVASAAGVAGPAGDGALVAYVVPREGHSPSGRELRAYLKEQLPDHMVPSAFVLLDALPRTAPGKLDHRALPEPAWERAGSAAPAAPSTWAERQMAAIWCEVLNVPEVGLADDFFELGGHSLLAARVVARAREAFGAELSIRALFESPTIEGLLRHLPAAATAVTAATAAREAIPRAPRGAGADAWLPLSFAQERLWILHQLDPDSARYNMAGGVRLEGALDAAALRRALVRLVERHEILRTRFALVGGEPRQRVVPEVMLPFELVEAGELSLEELDRELVRDASRGFALSEEPPIRARLYRVAPDLHVLSLVLHHIVADGGSIDLLIREVSEAYAVGAGGALAELAPLPLQYADYACWQRAHVRGPDLEAKLERAARRLADAPRALELPAARPRPAHPSFRGGAVTVDLPRALAEAVDAAARREGLTPFMVGLAAFQALLARYARRGDVVVGTPAAGRDRVELEGLVGCFVNTVVLRTDLGGPELTVRDALARVKQATLAAFEDQDLPFERLVERLEPVRDPSLHPLFQVAFVMNLDGGASAFRVGDLTARVLDVRNGTAKFDLTLTLDRTDGGLRATFEYASDLFDAPAIERMAEHYLALLRGVCAEPDAALWRLPMLAPGERQALLAPRRARPEAQVEPESVLLRFEREARRRPDAAAIGFEGRWLTYGELEARAGRLARLLRVRGVRREVKVAIYLERSPALVIAALAILKAGGAYVPLDPAYPAERVEFVLADAGCPVVITERALAARLAAPDRLLVLDPDDARLMDGPAEPPGPPSDLADLAYVIYTSGSTGKPKGVEVTHGNVARLFTATDPWFGFGERDVWTLFHSFAFDFSVWEMWGALAYGGRLVVVPQGVARSPADFCRLLADEGVTVLNQTPSAFRRLVEADAALRPALALRTVIFGGEALELESLRPWLARHGDERPRLVNMYGITETTVHVTYRPICAADLDGPARSPIGVPIPDLQVYLLDEQGNLVPIGVPGEICVGGAGVARGYLGRPELTAQRFVHDPFAARADARLYRSGDLGRYLEDGELEYLGRLDDQVKIRGFRIELGEIEAVAQRHPSVTAVAVVPYARDGGDLILAAYVVGALAGTDAQGDGVVMREHRVEPRVAVAIEVEIGGEARPARIVNLSAGGLELAPPPARGPGEPLALSFALPGDASQIAIGAVIVWKSERGCGVRFADGEGRARIATFVRAHAGGAYSIAHLRAHLRRELPEYMVPAAFVRLDHLPLTAHGKLDRRALPDPLIAREGQRGAAARPRTEAEAALAVIWKRLLAAEQVGVHDNFFELGGDSILAIQVAAAAREAGWHVTPKQLFQHQTIAELAAVAAQVAAPVIDQAPVTGPVPIAPAQAWLYAQHPPRPSHWNQTVLLACREALDAPALRAALAALHAHHDMLRLRVVRGPDGWEQRIEPVEGELPLEVVVTDDEAVVREEADRAQAGLDLAHGPIARAVLFRGPGGDRLLLTVHHLAIDGVSWRILLEDLERAYLAAAAGAPIALPPKTAPFARWAEVLAARVDAGAGVDVAGELAHWRGVVARRDGGFLADHPAGRNLEGLVEEIEVRLDAAATADVLSRALGAYRMTAEELLLAALARSAGELAGLPRLVVDLEGHGRDAAPGVDVTRTVGWFTSIFPVALGTGQGASPRDLLRETKEAARAAPHRGAHFGALRQHGAELPDSPASVSFNYLGQLDATLTGSRLFAGVLEAPGHQRAPESPRRHAVDVTASVLDRELRLRFAFGRELHRRETIERWAAGFAAELRRLAAHCLSPEAGGYSPSDFPLAGLDQRALDALLPPGAGAADVADIYPLSPIQEGFLFHGLAAAGTAVGVEQCSFTLAGELDAGRFERAWQIAIARHDILRTRFAAAGLDRPLQIVLREVPFALERRDLRGAPPDRLAVLRAELLAEDVRRGFDPARAPLLRVTLADTGEGRLVVFSHHHLILDGWSVPLLLAEIAAIYRALGAGEEPSRARAPSYREYIAWRLACDATRGAAYWRERLRGVRAPTPLGIDRAPPRRAAGPGHHEQQRALSPEDTAALEAFARAHRVTASSVLIAAWGVLLGRYAGARDVVFGVTVAGRPAELPGVEAILGPFINVVPCRVRAEADEPLAGLVARVNAELAEQQAFAHTPLVDVQEASEVPAHLPLFDSLLVFENYPAREAHLGGAEASGWRVSGVETAVRTRYRLTLVAVPGDALTLHASYEDDAFDPDLIDRLLAQLLGVLRAIAARPGLSAGALDVRTEDERRPLILDGELLRAQGRKRPGVFGLEDEAGRGVPDGIAGELVWRAADGALARTGELARRHAGGALESLGALADVLEVRGVRILPAELERLLEGVADVAAAAVGLRPGADGPDGAGVEPALWAYVVPSPGGGSPAREALAAALGQRLPAVMLPSSFATVAALPRHADGRIDRAALATLEATPLGPDARGAAPATETERALARLWCELLAVPAVAADDDFFDLGAQSVLVVRLISRIREALGAELPARAAFEARTLRAMARAIDTSDARSIFERRPLVGAPLREHYELSPYQLPEFYFAEMAPDSPMYNQLLCDVLLRGKLDKAAMTRAWQVLLDRHPILRAHFGYRDGKPVQIVGPRRVVKESDLFEDRRHVPESEFVADTTAMAHKFAGTALDFKHGPMFHLRFVEYTGDRFVLVFLTNHAVWDEVSSLSFVADLRALYNGFRAGAAPALAPLEVNYFDYAEWVNRNVRDGALARERDYWLRRFADNPDPLELPTDFPRPPVMTFEGSDVSGALPMSAALALKQDFLRRDPTITLSMFLHAVLNLLLYRWSGQGDITIGMPIAGRGHQKLEPVLGPFATGMLMRCQLDERMTFQALLAHTRDVTVEALDHYAYPSVLAIQEINPRWDVSRGRLFSVMYGLQHNKTLFWHETMQLDGMTLSRLPHLAGIGPLHSSSRTDLRLIAEELGDEIQYSWSYNSDLFRRSTIERLARQYDALIEQVIADPARPLWAYELVSPEERARLLGPIAAPDPRVVPGERGTIHTLFARQVAARPDAPAVVADAGTLTYRELDEAANRIAHLVRGRGARIEDRVALIFEPSRELVAAVLGVLKAGACYVPISPDLPERRRDVVLREAGCRLVLSQAGCAPARPPAGVDVVLIDEPGALAGLPTAAPEVTVLPRNLAVVFFTSGSTGTPKGVQIEHRGIANVVTSTQASHALASDEATLLVTPFHFDASVLDLLWPVAAGARIAIPSPAETRDPAAIAARVRRHGVAVLQVVPTMLGAMLDAAEAGELGPMPPLRHLMCGSAALPRALRDRCLAVLPALPSPARLSNNYGPSETTVDACRFDATRAFDGDLVPVGRPIADTRVYVLDAHLQPVPIGIPGEIYLGTPRVARGYLGRPDLTAERFLPDPFSPEPGARMYRTGDLGKLAEDGALTFLGRVDRQVKIRGNRVELEEIEAHLAAHPGVGKHALTAVADAGGEHALAAFVELRASVNRVPAPGGALRVHTLAQRPALAAAADALHRAAWPPFFLGDEVMRALWPRLHAVFGACQLVLATERGEPLAAVNSIPVCWDGAPGGTPEGWDAALTAGFADDEARRPCNTLVVLAAVVADHAVGRGLAAVALRAIKEVARAQGLSRVIVPVRPTGKAAVPEVSFEDWCARQRPDGLSADNWIRAHERLGAVALRTAARSQTIRAELALWEAWTGQRFRASGEYVVEGALAPVRIDLAEGIGEYFDPCLWMEHPLGEPAFAFDPTDPAALRAHLRERLPEYMVPAQIRFLDALPLTPSGKIDLKALPADGEAPEARELVPPRGEREERLHQIWREVLCADRFGVTDSFFELGGHSIRAIQMLAKVAAAFGVEIPLKRLFTDPTIAGLAGELARQLDERRELGADPTLIP